MPALKKNGSVLSSLLRYPSPRSAKQQHGDLQRQAARQVQPFEGSHGQPEQAVQVRLDRSTKIFREGLSDGQNAVSPIISEGSHDSDSQYDESRMVVPKGRNN